MSESVVINEDRLKIKNLNKWTPSRLKNGNNLGNEGGGLNKLGVKIIILRTESDMEKVVFRPLYHYIISDIFEQKCINCG